VEQTLESMTILKENVEAIAAEILRLSEQTNQIGNISTAVTDLANQTNMLALNASVEAVRAGENAQGFTVIATEIRKLADLSKKSAEKINNLVVDIKNAIDSTVTVTKEGTKTVEEGTKISQETAAAFSEVAKAVNNVVLNNQQISLTAEQQAVAIQQVVDAMNSLNQSAKETASGISQTKLGTQQLNDAAQNLNSIV
jgi:methyl-accepting chemotaxis protein